MLNIKKLMYACMAIIALGNIAMAELALPAMPKKFQGAWSCDAWDHLTIGANTVSYGAPKESFKLISIEPGDEAFNSVIVKWTTKPSVFKAVVINAVTFTMVWKLVKLNGQQFLMLINPEEPVSATLCLKK